MSDHNTRPDLFALILAAGSGSRFGMSKALVPFGKNTGLTLAIRNLAAAGFGTPAVVIGADAERIRSDTVDRLADDEGSAPPVTWVHNADFESGRTGSLLKGIAAAPDSSRGVLIHAVDFPLVRVETFGALAEAFRSEGEPEGLIFLPREAGNTGHPVLLGRKLWPEVEALGPDEPLHEVVLADPSRLRTVDVSDPGVLWNMNRPEEYKAIVRIMHRKRRSD